MCMEVSLRDNFFEIKSPMNGGKQSVKPQADVLRNSVILSIPAFVEAVIKKVSEGILPVLIKTLSINPYTIDLFAVFSRSSIHAAIFA